MALGGTIPFLAALLLAHLAERATGPGWKDVVNAVLATYGIAVPLTAALCFTLFKRWWRRKTGLPSLELGCAFTTAAFLSWVLGASILMTRIIERS